MSRRCIELQQVRASSTYSLHDAGCLKVSCPGRLQADTCRMLRMTQQCETAMAGAAPRTSLSSWWLS